MKTDRPTTGRSVSPRGEPILSRYSETWSFTTGLAEAEWHPFYNPGNVAPEPGASDVNRTPAFQWNAADWATGYEFELSGSPETGADGYFATPMKSFTGANALTGNVYLYDGTLDYDGTYYWHVRAVSKTSESEWATGVFTIGSAPATTPAPTTTAAPAPVVVEEIAPAYIWVIIGVGAALVIAVIVLIVRTRRVV